MGQLDYEILEAAQRGSAPDWGSGGPELKSSESSDLELMKKDTITTNPSKCPLSLESLSVFPRIAVRFRSKSCPLCVGLRSLMQAVIEGNPELAAILGLD